MQRFLFIAIILFLISFKSNGQKNDQLKVISYNIWNGFDWGKDDARRTELQQWVTGQQPDVVALQELCKYTPEKLKEDAKSWGHSYSVLLKTTGYSVGLTSQFPIELKEKLLEGLHHGALHCQINGIDFLVVHLHPGSIQRRRDEARLLASKIDEIREQNSRYMVMGDFNANSPFDADLYKSEDSLLSRMRKDNEGKGLDGNLDNNSLDFSVISGFLSLPLYDVVYGHTKGMVERVSFPAPILIPQYFNSFEHVQSCRQRIDYILVSRELSINCVEARICNNEDNWYLSDHFPVIAVFNFEK